MQERKTPPVAWGHRALNPADPSRGSLCQVYGDEKSSLQPPISPPCASPETWGVRSPPPPQIFSAASTQSESQLNVHSHRERQMETEQSLKKGWHFCSRSRKEQRVVLTQIKESFIFYSFVT